MQEIELSEFVPNLKYFRFGAIVGPGITLADHDLSELISLLVEETPVAESTSADLTRLIQQVIASGKTTDAVRGILEHTNATVSPMPGLQHLARLPLNAVVALTYDRFFEKAFSDWASENPARRTPTVLENPRHSAPPLTTPVFRLLGDPLSEYCVLTQGNERLLRQLLTPVARTFADNVRAGPILCFGLNPVRNIAADVVAALVAHRPTTPSRLIFLRGDPITKDSDFLRILSEYSVEATCIRATPGQLSSKIEELEAAAHSGRLAQIEQGRDTPAFEFFELSQSAVLVNAKTTSTIAATERERLTDLLFAPQVPKWDPLVHNLDLRRTLESEVLSSLTQSLEEGDDRRAHSVLLRGNCASGKTLLFKRVALELAKMRYTVVWLKPSNFSYSADSISRILEHAKNYDKDNSGFGVVVFQDDPIAFGSLTPSLISTLASNAGISIRLALALRNSDYQLMAREGGLAGTNVISDLSLSDVLDDDEWERMGALLVSSGIYATLQEAAMELRAARSHTSQDTLATLHMLVPKTRAAIRASIRNEHRRLGDSQALARALVESPELKQATCRRALEYVAVADHYRVTLPIEVLVNALNVTYNAWLDTVSPDGPVWGVLYSIEDSTFDSACYATRNSVVTEVIRDEINAGMSGRGGDVRVLRTLLAACTGSTTVYREFCLRLLVQNPAIQQLSGEEGEVLFETAIASLPYRDKTLLHHFGRWLRKNTRKTERAREVLNLALQADDPPYAARPERNEHIYTSIAALDVQEMRMGKLDAKKAIASVGEHLEAAREGSACDPFGAHVNGGLAVGVLAGLDRSSINHDAFKVAADALCEVHHTLLNTGHFTADPAKSEDHDAILLAEVEQQLLDQLDRVEDLRGSADQVWESGRSQLGFVTIARSMFKKARNTNAGDEFSKVIGYITACIGRIEQEHVPVDPRLRELLAQTYYYWQVRRMASGERPLNVDWRYINFNAIHATQSGVHLLPPLNAYLMAYSFAQLDRWDEARRLFSELRSIYLPANILFKPRDYLYSASGRPRVVQGTMSFEVQPLLSCADPEFEFLCEKKDTWPREGEIAHAHVMFSYAGPRAYRYDPTRITSDSQ